MVPVSNSRSARSCCWRWRRCWCWRWPRPTASSASARDSYPLKARFTNLGQLRTSAPVKIGGVMVGNVADIQLDPAKFDSVVTLDIDDRYNDLPADTSAGILTGGLLGESYVGLQPGGDPEALKPGDEIAFTTPAVDLIQMVGKYMFSGGGKPAADTGTTINGRHPTANGTHSMKRTLLSFVIASAIARRREPGRAAPRRTPWPPPRAAQPARPARWCWTTATRVLATLEKRRAEFTKNRAALRSSCPASSARCSTATTPRARCWAAMRAAPTDADVKLLRRRAGRQPDAALRLVAAGLQHPAARAGEVGDGVAARPRRQGVERNAAQRRRTDPGRLPDAPVRRHLEGVRRDGGRRVVRADLPPAVRRRTAPTSRSSRSPPTCAPASCRPMPSTEARASHRERRHAALQRRAGARALSPRCGGSRCRCWPVRAVSTLQARDPRRQRRRSRCWPSWRSAPTRPS